ncbi:MAG: hypothetical protein HKN12_11580 [Gemmatimonadetes bacterium]|nr:hypothetical protein [Gemmatimonadota bacterium]
MSLTRVLVLGSIVLAGTGPAGASGSGPVDCQRCHGSREFLAGKGGDAASDFALLVSREDILASAHRTLECAECHQGYDDAWPHTDAALTVDCASCHEAAQEDWDASSHGVAHGAGEDAPDCRTCHGIHDVLPATDRASLMHPLNQRALCITCHGDHDNAETVHGRAIAEAGLVVAASCSDCHGAHRVLPAENPDATIHRNHAAVTCGACHVGVAETYAGGGHGRALAAERAGTWTGDHEAPVCTTCHSGHDALAAGPTRSLATVERCAGCHDHAAETFRKSYHGKVSRLGGEFAAQCSDCHGAHGNLNALDPASSVHRENLVQTCGACHAQASASFVQYVSHADPHDREGFPVLFWTWAAMSGLMISVFGFFGVHTLLWLGRSLWPTRAAAPADTDAADGGPADTPDAPGPDPEEDR